MTPLNKNCSCCKSGCSWNDLSSDQSLMVDQLSFSLFSQCSMTSVSKDMACAILSVGYKNNPAANQKYSGGSRFPLLLSGCLPYVCHITVNKMCQVSLNKNNSLLQIKTNIFNICFNAYRTIANNINTQILYHEYVTLYDLRCHFLYL